MINNQQIINQSVSKSKNEAIKEICKKALELKMIDNDKAVFDSFMDREKISSTGFENGVAIPHVHSKNVKKSGLIFIKFKTPINWPSIDKSKTKFAIAILMSENDNSQYMDVLSSLSINLSKKENIDKLNNTNNKTEITKIIKSFFVIEKKQEKTIPNKDQKVIVGVSSCTTGVVHTYMCKELLENAGKEMGYTVHIECQGQRGPEYVIPDDLLKKAEVVILAVDVAIERDRFSNKKVYACSTRNVVKDAKGVIKNALSIKQIKKNKTSEEDNFIQNASKGRPALVKHLLCGVSYLIPFVVFAGLLFAINNGIAKGIFGTNFQFHDWSKSVTSSVLKDTWGATRNLNDLALAHVLTVINNIANIGFELMIPFMGGYIAYSIAGRSAIAPAVITTFLLCNPSLNLWYDYNGIFNVASNSHHVSNASKFSWTLFGAIYAGLLEGLLVKWVLTWKVNKHIAPIMPIIIIPLFCTAIIAVPTAFAIAAPFGYVMGKFNYGLTYLGQKPEYGFMIGLILGAMVGFDLGGPINKTAVLVATTLIVPVSQGGDNGHLMGAVAAAIPIAPLGCALTSTVFARKQFSIQERSLGVTAWSLGFMGITEGSIPFAARDGWRNIVANVVGSAVAGSLAYVFNTAGHVGAWGGPIILLFGGVTDTSNSYVGMIWFIIAMAAGVLTQALIYTSLLWQKSGTENKFWMLIKNSKPYKSISKKAKNMKKMKIYYNEEHVNGFKANKLFVYK